MARTQQNESKAGLPGYAYTKVTLTEEFDPRGKIKEHKERVYEVQFREGSTFVKLLEVNGHAPAEADLKKQGENEMTVRQLLGESKAAKADNREEFLTPELVARFDFRLLGEVSINGRRAFAVGFQPKTPSLPVRRLVDRLLNRISGTVWIDVEEFEVARAQIELGSAVDFLGGVAGTLRKLAFTMTRTRVADGLWLRTFSSGDFEGRKLLESMHVRTRSQTTHFRTLG